MTRAASIPAEYERDVANWYAKGASFRHIAEKLADKGVETTHASVARLVDRISDGRISDRLAATVGRLRLQTPEIADRLDSNLDRVHRLLNRIDHTKWSGRILLNNLKIIAQEDRMAIGRLRLAGVGGKAGDQSLKQLKINVHRIEAEEAAQIAAGIDVIIHVVPPAPPPSNAAASATPPLVCSANERGSGGEATSPPTSESPTRPPESVTIEPHKTLQFPADRIVHAPPAPPLVCSANERGLGGEAPTPDFPARLSGLPDDVGVRTRAFLSSTSNPSLDIGGYMSALTSDITTIANELVEHDRHVAPSGERLLNSAPEEHHGQA